MKILLIPDKFKGSVSAKEVVSAITNGLMSNQPNAEIHTILASDGGDGFLDSIATYIDCDVIQTKTIDAVGQEIVAPYLINEAKQTAYIELAKASGLAMLSKENNPVMQASTLGTGLLIKDAILKGSTSIYIGLGGSATNDAGLGIAEALGFYFLDEGGNKLEPTGSSLSKIKSIHKKRNSISLAGVSIFAVNDVDNPLFGREGAAFTYAKQKGASSEEITALDMGLQDFAHIVKFQTDKDEAQTPGAGAAGGTAYGLKIFCDAQFISGIDFVLSISNANELVAKNNFDYIITGEGKFDHQTLHGKLIKGVIDLGVTHHVPILAICGQLDVEPEELKKYKTLEVIEVQDHSASLAYNMQNAAALIEKKVAIFFK